MTASTASTTQGGGVACSGCSPPCSALALLSKRPQGLASTVTRREPEAKSPSHDQRRVR